MFIIDKLVAVLCRNVCAFVVFYGESAAVFGCAAHGYGIRAKKIARAVHVAVYAHVRYARAYAADRQAAHGNDFRVMALYFDRAFLIRRNRRINAHRVAHRNRSFVLKVGSEIHGASVRVAGICRRRSRRFVNKEVFSRVVRSRVARTRYVIRPRDDAVLNGIRRIRPLRFKRSVGIGILYRIAFLFRSCRNTARISFVLLGRRFNFRVLDDAVTYCRILHKPDNSARIGCGSNA